MFSVYETNWCFTGVIKTKSVLWIWLLQASPFFCYKFPTKGNEGVQNGDDVRVNKCDITTEITIKFQS